MGTRIGREYDREVPLPDRRSMGRTHAVALTYLLFTACARSPERVDLPPRAPAPPPSSPRDADVVAIYNGQPVTRRDVADKVLELNLSGAIGNYVRWRVVQDRMAELGIEHTPEELRRRADTVVRVARQGMGEEVFTRELVRKGLTVEAYRDFVAASSSLAHTFSVEKIVTFNAIQTGALTLDRVWFKDQKEADAFAMDSRKRGFDRGLKDLAARTPKTRFGHRKGEVAAKGRPPLSPPLDPWILEKLQKSAPGDVVGAERGSGDLFFVIKLVERREARDVPYDRVRNRVLEAILAEPPDERVCEHWVRSAIGRARVEMARPDERREGE